VVAPEDNLATIGALGVLAYTSADVGHHVLGHGAACLVAGGHIASLSSVFVDCSIRGASIDLAGPFANLVIGLTAMLLLWVVRRASAPARLLLVLAAAFNLLWFASQVAFSAAARTDDWASAMRQLHVSEPTRYLVVAFGVSAYLLTLRAVAVWLAPFAKSRRRATAIALTAWLAAGCLACVTAIFDHHATTAPLWHAVLQSLGTSLGLLFVPARAARLSSRGSAEPRLAFSIGWLIAAAVLSTLSVLLLGPGIAVRV